MKENDSDSEQIKGQSVDEVSSEITEMLKLERFVGTSEEMCENKVTLIGKYSRALYNLWKKTIDKDDDKSKQMIETVDGLLDDYRNIEEEEVLSEPEYLDGRHVHIMSISNDPKTEKIIPEEMYAHVHDSMERKIPIRKLAILSKIANKLGLLLSSEFDLHEDMAHKKFDNKELKKMIAKRSRDNE